MSRPARAAPASAASRAPEAAGRRTTRKTGRPPGEPRRIAYLYILPAFAVYALFVLAPFGHAVWLSFFDWDGITVGTWVGLDNYRQVLTDPLLRSAFGHALVLIVFYAIIPVGIGLLLASALTRTRVRGMTAFRTVLFLPQVVAMVVVAVIWSWLYAPETGTINEFLRAVGLGGLTRAWLGDFTFALPAVGLIGTWVMFGLCLVLFIAGVQKIPRELYDAARVDGAGALAELRHVTLPGLRNEIAVALTLTTVAALRNFDLVYVTTGGGPGNATTVPAYEVYRRAFETSQVGLASAIGVTLAILIFGVTFLITRIAERE